MLGGSNPLLPYSLIPMTLSELSQRTLELLATQSPHTPTDVSSLEPKMQGFRTIHAEVDTLDATDAERLEWLLENAADVLLKNEGFSYYYLAGKPRQTFDTIEELVDHALKAEAVKK